MAAEIKYMGRTIPLFRIALEMEKADCKSFRNTLDKSDRRGLMRFYLIFLDSTFHLSLILFSMLMLPESKRKEKGKMKS
jgi:hypothetical protein